MPPPNMIVYDLETQHALAEVNDKPERLKVSFLGLYSYTQNTFFSFYERDLVKLEMILARERPMIIGFNSLAFDNRVVQPYFHHLRIADLPQVDILADIQRVLGFRLKLESVAQATLQEGKSGTGLDAIRYFREGDWESLVKYCLDDVRITRDIYNYGCAHSFILFYSGGETKRIPVSWSSNPTITELLAHAAKTHTSVQLKYIEVTDSHRALRQTTVDVYTANDKLIEVFCHERNTTWQYHIEQIIWLEPTEQKFSYQAKLL